MYAAHAWDAGVVTTEPTQDKEGIKTFTCADCEQTKMEPVEKLPAAPDDNTGDGNGDVNDDNQTPPAKDEGGCNSNVTGSFGILVLLVAFAAVILAKKHTVHNN
ncbi:MAG: hypothetical protein IJ009_05865 [Clostridia bacterium]|nr:hypothetical protein [Clostridia bacterium]